MSRSAGSWLGRSCVQNRSIGMVTMTAKLNGLRERCRHSLRTPVAKSLPQCLVISCCPPKPDQNAVVRQILPYPLTKVACMHKRERRQCGDEDGCARFLSQAIHDFRRKR